MAILNGRRRTLGAAIGMLVAAAVQPARAQPGLEYEVKAAFVYNFIKFVEWPPDALGAQAPFRVCLLGEDPFRGRLDQTVRGDTVEGHPITVERLPLDGAAASCHLLFVPRAHANRGGAIARALANAPVLIVGESDGFLRAGGTVNLAVDSGRVRFDVNVGQAAMRRLRISSKLLRVARHTGEPERQDH